MFYNFYDKAYIEWKEPMKKSYLKCFSFYAGFLKTQSVVETSLPHVTVQCMERIELTGEAQRFNGIWADERYLYIADRTGKKLGFSFDEKSADVVFEETCDPFFVFNVVEILLRGVVVATGICFMHASGVRLNDQAYVFPGWGGTGKTNLLLQLLNKGAEYMADDLIIFDRDGSVYPYPKPLNLLDYNFRANSKILNPAAATKTRICNQVLQRIKPLESVVSRIPIIGKIFSKVCQHLAAGGHEYVPVERIFGDKARSNGRAALQYKIFFMLGMVGQGVRKNKMSATDFAKKMEPCLKWERMYYGDILTLYQFAFPDKKTLVDSLFQNEQKIVEECVGKANQLELIMVGQGATSNELICEILGGE